MPYINRNWKQRPKILERFASYMDPVSYSEDEPGVDMAPFPARIDADGRVIFRQNGRKEALRMRDRVFKPDVVVYATGYKHSFPFLQDDYPSAADATCRDIFHPSDPTVAFIGFVRPGVGAIPPISELQSQLWNMVIRGALQPPSGPVHYNLIVHDPQARVLHGVDHSSYSAQLATDMGASPYPWQVWWEHGLLVTFVYCFGAAFPTLFRLLGPYQHKDAPRIAKTELLETINRRGLAGNIAMGAIPILFYW
jgi:dimethylaniline monooxygenase (N-oxide forming)